MSHDLQNEPLVETDPRWPSGPWVGFYTQPPIRARGTMDMLLTFRGGVLTGCGRDPVGNFIFRGRYDTIEGKTRWVKSYLGKHDVHYLGQLQGKGIVGLWQIESEYGLQTGRFAIWPEGEQDPTLERLVEELDLPIANELLQPFAEPLEVEQEQLVGVGESHDASGT